MVRNAGTRDGLLYRMECASQCSFWVLSRPFHQNLMSAILLASKQKVALPERRPYNLAQFDKPAVAAWQSA
jgi:hypothetical protein